VQGQDVISRPGRRPVTRKAKSSLNNARDLPLLQIIRDTTFIDRKQLEILIAGRTDETNYDSRNRRIARLVELGQLKIYPRCFSSSGRVYGITPRGMAILGRAGLGLFRSSAYRETEATVVQMPRFLKLNQIEIASRKAFNVLGWTRARGLRSLNRAMGRTAKQAYDSIAVIAEASDSAVQVHLGIQYERTIKSTVRYAQIRKSLEVDNQIHGLLYFVDSERSAVILSREMYSVTVPIGVVVVSEFQRKLADATLRLLDGLSVVRAMAGLAPRLMGDPLSNFEQANGPASRVPGDADGGQFLMCPGYVRGDD